MTVSRSRLAGRTSRAATLTLTLMLGSVPSAGAEEPGTCIFVLTERCESWAATYDGPAGLGDGAETMALSPDGRRVFAVGNRVMGRYGGNREDRDYGVVAYDAGSGAQLWVAGYGGPGSAVTGNRQDAAIDATVSPDGSRVYVTGTSTGAGGSFDFDWATVAFDAATGTRLWVARYDGPADDDWDRAEGIATGVVEDDDGRPVELVFVSGGPVVAYEARTGRPVWITETAAEEGGVEVGDVVFVPETAGRNGATLFGLWGVGAAAFDPLTGYLRWASLHESEGDSGTYGWAIAASPLGERVYATGFVFHLDLNTGVSMDYLTAAFDAGTGEKAWATTFDRQGGDDRGVDLAVDPDGSRVYVTGVVEGPPLRQYTVTIGYEAATGKQLWSDLYEGVAGASAWRVAAGPGGRAFVAAYSPFIVLSYEGATGRRLWAARYTPPSALDGAFALAPSPDGSRLYATGLHFRPGTEFVTGGDFLTVAYDL